MTDFLMVTIITAFSVCCFLAYHFLSLPMAAKKIFSISEGNSVLLVLYQRVTGFVFLGIAPLLALLFFSDHLLNVFKGLAAPSPSIILYTVLAGLMLVLPITYKNSQKESNLKAYPQMRLTIWNGKFVSLTSSSWVLYLLGYEFLFRGFLFFATLPLIGFWPATIINTIFYALAHLPKGRIETLASLPFGVFLCFITWYTGNMWAAFVLHCFLAVSTELFSIAAHPEMKFSGAAKILNLSKRI